MSVTCIGDVSAVTQLVSDRQDIRLVKKELFAASACHQRKVNLWHCGLVKRALVSPDGVATSRMVRVSASVNLPLHHKVQKFSSGTGSPGWSRKKGRKTVMVCGVVWSSGNAINHVSTVTLSQVCLVTICGYEILVCN